MTRLVPWLWPIVAWPLAAFGQTEPSLPIEVSWIAPPECPPRSWIDAEMARLLGKAQGMLRGRRVRGTAVVTRVDGGYDVGVVVEVEGNSAYRQLSGQSCEDIADAVALIVALAYDPGAVQGSFSPAAAQPPPPPTPTPTRTPPSPAPPVETPSYEPVGPPEPPSEEPRECRFLLGLGGTAAIGALPSVTAGGSLLLGLHYRDFRLTLDGTPWLQQDGTVGTGPAGGRVSWQTGGAVGCVAFWHPGSMELGGCGRIDIGRMHAVGYGVDHPGEATVLWAATGPGASLAWLLSDGLAVRLDLNLMFPLDRPQWTLGRVGELESPSVAYGRSILGLEVLF